MASMADATAFCTFSAGDGVAELHRQVQIQRQCRARHIDLHALGTFVGVFLVVHQIGDAAAKVGHHAGNALHLTNGADGDGCNDLLGDVDAAVLLRQGHIFLALAHGIFSLSVLGNQARLSPYITG